MALTKMDLFKQFFANAIFVVVLVVSLVDRPGCG